MAKLNKVVANLLISECFVCLCKFDEIIIKGFESLVLGRIWSDFIGMELEGEFLVVGFDLSFGGGLVLRLAKSQHDGRDVAYL